MKKLTLFFGLFLAAVTLSVAPGCQSSPTTQTAEYKTLKAVGESAKASMDAATQLLKGGHITVPQWQKVAAFYDNQFQPAFSLAVFAAKADLTTAASPDVLSLATQFSALVISYASAP